MSDHKHLAIALGAACLLSLPAGLQAQAGAADSASAGTPVARAVRTHSAPRVDGRLDDAAWATAVPVTEFTQTDPLEGTPGSQPTRVLILFDDQALYVAAHLVDRGGRVRGPLGRRDSSLGDSDWFSVALDSYHDHQSSFRFQVNPAGVKLDDVVSGDGGGDRTWDAVWDVATAVTDSGWVAEIRIPFSQLRFGAAEQQTWGIQLGRTIARNGEYQVYSFTPKKERGGVARYAHLTGLERLRPGRRVEILPFATLRGEYLTVETQRAGVPGRNPYRTGSDFFGDAGMDVKYRPTSNLTISATVNPDFGQVEVDPAVVNLTAFETFFPERRPFFVEGSSLFSFGGNSQLFYSRRIGRAPQGGVPGSAVFRDVPTVSTILGAGKITGRLPGGWSLGVLDAVTAREEASFTDAEGGTHHAVVEPATHYFAGRVRRDFRAGQTALGAIGTAVNRDLSGTETGSFLRSAAYAGGVDFTHDWAKRSWTLSGALSGSSVAGTRQAILLAQRSSARYYQRPDAGHLELDTLATSLAGFDATLSLRKQSGVHWRGGIALSATSPGYEVNDLGYQTSADRVAVQPYLTYQENRPGKYFRQWWVNPGVRVERNFGGDIVRNQPYAQLYGQLTSYWSGSLYLSRGFRVADDRLTRGGPLSETPSNNYAFGYLQSDGRKPVTLYTSASVRRSEAGDRSHSLSVSVGLKPSTNWNVSVGPQWNRSYTAAQYVTSVGDTTARATFGRRYVFAELDQSSLSLDGRLNVTVSPTLSFELYAQPFIYGADYGALQELSRTRAFQFGRYGDEVGTLTYNDSSRVYTVDPDAGGPAAAFRLGNRDFNLQSLRGNAVARWEFRPGSALFLVWQQRRSGIDTRFGDLDVSRDRAALFGLRPENIFLVKMSWWLNP
jgi:hypothetical protein